MIFDKIALETLLGAEMTFQGHSRLSEMAIFDTEHVTSY